MKSRITTAIVLIVCSMQLLSFAQTPKPIWQGAISFEKRVNNHAQFALAFNQENKNSKKLYDSFVNMTEKFETFNFTLNFSKDDMLYFPNDPRESRNILSEMTSRNTVYTNFASNKSVTQRSVIGGVFLVDGEMEKIKWKITDETRTIAGYECKRANGLTGDSIYVVAFYTLQIPVAGGPEHFSGLPGMILGAAIPHDHITWFATNVSERPSSELNITAPDKGKHVTEQEMVNEVETIVGSKIAIEKVALERALYY